MERLSSGVEQAFPVGTRLSRPLGGVSLWVEMPETISAIKLYQQALTQQIAIAPGPMFALEHKAGRDFGHCLRLSCGLPWNEQVDQAVRQLGTWAQQQG